MRHISCLGFTLNELLIVIAIIAILAGLLLPVLGRSKANAQGIVCLNNLKQLQIAWHTYADDNEDRLPQNGRYEYAGKTDEEPSWIAGWLDYNATNPDNTNTQNLIEGGFGRIGPWVKSHRVFKCPSDKSMAFMGAAPVARVRSYAMNMYMGALPSHILDLHPFKYFKRQGDIRSSSRTWVFADEHEDTIDNGAFDTAMGYPYNAWVDVPATRHNMSGVLSFADSHVELKKWRDPRTALPVTKKKVLAVASPNNPDVDWLWERTTYRVDPGTIQE